MTSSKSAAVDRYVTPQPHSVFVLRWFPAAQSVFIVGATLASVGPFLVLARLYVPSLCPPWYFYVTLVPIYVGIPLWLTAPWIPALSEWAEDAFGGVETAVNESDDRSDGKPDLGKLLRKRRVDLNDPTAIPRNHAIGVLVLSIWVSAHVSWLSVYSGGPILGPLGQVLIALALFAPSIAFRPLSIMLTYTCILLSATIGQLLASGWKIKTPSADWYWGLTFGVLVVSGLIATVVRKGEIRRARSAKADSVQM